MLRAADDAQTVRIPRYQLSTWVTWEMIPTLLSRQAPRACVCPPEAEATDAAATGTEENEPAALAQEWSPDPRGSIGVTAPDTK